MDFRDSVLELEKSKVFKDFKAKNSDYYLSSVFYNISGSSEENQALVSGEDISLGYYSASKDRIVSFSLHPIKASEEQEVFKPDGIVKKLVMTDVKVTYSKAKKMADLIMKENYEGERVTKEMCILQVLDLPVYNFTIVTGSFSIINLRIDSHTGKLVTKSKHSIMDIGQKIK